MADPDRVAVGKLDGRDPDSPNYVPFPYVGVTHYQEWDFGKNWVNRPAGADQGQQPGGLWWSSSKIDNITVLAEILTKKYHGQTVLHMLSALFAVLIENRDPKEIADLLKVTRK